MQGFERLGEFHRALRASREATAAASGEGTPYADDLRFAEGVLWASVLMLPFWLSLVYAIELLAR